MKGTVCILGIWVCGFAWAQVYSYSAPSSGYEFPTMTTVTATSGSAATTVTTSSSPANVNDLQSQLVPLVAPPPPIASGPPAGTAVLGALAGALTANKAANSTGNLAAMNATQSNLINTEATLMSGAMTGVLNQLVKTQS